MGEAKRTEQFQAELADRIKLIGEAAQAVGLKVINPRHIHARAVTKMGPKPENPAHAAALRRELVRLALHEIVDALVDPYMNTLAVEPVMAGNGRRGVEVTLTVVLPIVREEPKPEPAPEPALKNESVVHPVGIVQGPAPGEAAGPVVPDTVKGDSPPDVAAMEAAIEREGDA